jgi:hypothetical protein
MGGQHNGCVTHAGQPRDGALGGAARRFQRPRPGAVHAERHLHQPITHQHAFQDGSAERLASRILGLEAGEQAADREGDRFVRLGHAGCFRRLNMASGAIPKFGTACDRALQSGRMRLSANFRSSTLSR